MKAIVFLKINMPGWEPPESLLEGLKLKFKKIDWVFPKTPNELVASVADADAIFSWAMSEDLFKLASRLKWFHSAGIQYGHLFPKAMFDRVVITNSRGAYSGPVSKGLIKVMTGFKKNLSGLTLGIIGYGHNGRALAKMARPLGMKIIGVKRYPTKETGTADKIVSPKEIKKVLKESDVVAVTAPLTIETQGIFNKEMFSAMKRGVVFVSAGRPALVDEVALVDALNKGIVSGVGVDDMWPKDGLLLKQKNVIVIPHASPANYDVWPHIFKIFENNLISFIAGRSLDNVMDKTLLY